MYLLHYAGELRIMEAAPPLPEAEAKAQIGLEQRKGHHTGPGLRRAGHWIAHRGGAAPAREAAEQLRKAHQLQMGGGIEQTFENSRGGALEAIARQTQGDYGIVVRPDRTIV